MFICVCVSSWQNVILMWTGIMPGVISMKDGIDVTHIDIHTYNFANFTWKFVTVMVIVLTLALFSFFLSETWEKKNKVICIGTTISDSIYFIKGILI